MGPYRHPHPWHSRAGGGAVHSIESGPSNVCAFTSTRPRAVVTRCVAAKIPRAQNTISLDGRQGRDTSDLFKIGLATISAAAIVPPHAPHARCRTINAALTPSSAASRNHSQQCRRCPHSQRCNIVIQRLAQRGPRARVVVGGASTCGSLPDRSAAGFLRASPGILRPRRKQSPPICIDAAAVFHPATLSTHTATHIEVLRGELEGLGETCSR